MSDRHPHDAEIGIPEDLPRGELLPEEHPFVRVVFRSVAQLRQIPPRFYKVSLLEIDSLPARQGLIKDLESDPRAVENGWTYDEAAGRVIPVWMSLQ